MDSAVENVSLASVQHREFGRKNGSACEMRPLDVSAHIALLVIEVCSTLAEDDRLASAVAVIQDCFSSAVCVGVRMCE